LGKKATSYYKGYVVEWECKQRLKSLGATHVIRSSRSRTPVDLVAIFPENGEIWLVQVKGMWTIPKNVEKLREKFRSLAELKGNYKVRSILFAKKGRRYIFIDLGNQARTVWV